MGNTKNKITINIHSQKRELRIVVVVLNYFKRNLDILKTNVNPVIIIKFSIRSIIFVWLFHYEKHFILHRLLFFIRAVCLPTLTVYRNVGVGDKNCKTYAVAYL